MNSLFLSSVTVLILSFAWVAPSQQDIFEKAADYIKQTEERIKELKRKRDSVMDLEGRNRDMSGGMMMGLRLPIVELSESGSTLKVVMISGLDNNIMLSNVVTVLKEEGAEVVSADQYSVADRCFHILLSQVSTNSLHQFSFLRLTKKKV